MADALKANSVLLDWTDVLQGGVSLEVSAVGDVSTTLATGVAVVVASHSVSANELGVLVAVEGRVGPNDEDWKSLYPPLRMGAGTALSEAVSIEATTGQPTIAVASTTGFVVGSKALVHNGVADVDSEIILIDVVNVNTSLVALNNLKNTQQTSAILYNLVAEKYFPIPDEISNVRVWFLNDDGNADMLVRADIAQISSIG